MKPWAKFSESGEMSERFFNPDFEISGDYNPDDLNRELREDFGRTEFDADRDCPYDRALCRQKVVRYMRWRQAVEYAAENRMNWTFCTSDNMFYACPVPELDCIRRHRYDNLLKNLKQR